jgi:hypothetical protein
LFSKALSPGDFEELLVEQQKVVSNSPSLAGLW